MPAPTPLVASDLANPASLNNLLTQIEAVLAGGASLPTGTTMWFGGSVVPSGWVECDGSAKSRSTFAALFAAIGTTFGVGDGSTTFNVPDFRGRSPIGIGTGVGLSARTANQQVGEETHILTVAELPTHTHPDGIMNVTATGTVPVGNFVTSGTTQSTQNSGGSSNPPHPNIQPVLVLKAVMKT